MVVVKGLASAGRGQKLGVDSNRMVGHKGFQTRCPTVQTTPGKRPPASIGCPTRRSASQREGGVRVYS